MPKLEYPRSDSARIYLLETCIGTTKTYLNHEDQILDAKYLRELENLYHSYDSLYHKLNGITAHLNKKIRIKKDAIEELNLIVRDFYEVLRRRTRRKKHPREILTMYGLKQNGHNPKLTKQDEVIAAANTIVTGDEFAVTTGYPAMQNPSAREIHKLLKKAEHNYYNVQPSDRILDIHQHEIRALRTQADEMIRETAAQLRFALRKNTSSNQRRIMRLYGFKYRTTGRTIAEEE